MSVRSYAMLMTVWLVSSATGQTSISATTETQPLQSIFELEELFIEQQYSFLPIAPPSEEIYLHSSSQVVPVAFDNFPKKFQNRIMAEFDKSTGIPLYPITVEENPVSRRTIFRNAFSVIIYQLEPEDNYNPFAWQEWKFDLAKDESLDPFTQWLYDPAHVTVSFTLIDSIYYESYLEEKEVQRLAVASMQPMMMAMSAPLTKPIASMTTGSNGLVTLNISLPDTFGGYVEIFDRDWLQQWDDWDLAKSWLPTYGNQQVSWQDNSSSGKSHRFYYIGDATDDPEGDGYSTLREELLTGTDPAVFNMVDEDNDGMHDWWEIRLFGGTDQIGSGDFDGDGLLNNEEMIYETSGSDAPKVTMITDPTLFDSDGDLMDDRYEIVNFLDPWDASDKHEDKDRDGLENYWEYTNNLAAGNWDTDGDTLPDGTEVEWGTQPDVPDDLNSDTDGDGLTLGEEYNNVTNPNQGDSDSDGTNDGDEVDQGSDPGDGSDGGTAPPEDDQVELTLTIGDDSPSHSEIYEMIVTGSPSKRLPSGGYGETGTQTYTFKRGESYTVTLIHRGTDPSWLEDHDQADYDYIAKVEESGGAQSSTMMIEMEEENWIPGDPGAPASQPIAMAATTATSSGIVIEDTSGILGTHRESTTFFASGKSAKVHLPKITLNLSQSTMTLKHDNQCSLEITTAPENVNFIEHTIEIRRESESTWYTLCNGEEFNWTTRVAGKFDLRAKAVVAGNSVTSQIVPMEVKFPMIEKITLDSGVAAAMETAWNMSKEGSDSQGFYEFGFMIYLDTADNDYVIGSITPSIKFSWDDEDTGVSVLHEKWSDPESPNPTESGVTYSVACFHTHPPLTDAPDYVWRIAGPSLEDLTLHSSVDTPGAVRDYIGVDHVVLPGHSKDDPDKLYHPLGPFQRGL